MHAPSNTQGKTKKQKRRSKTCTSQIFVPCTPCAADGRQERENDKMCCLCFRKDTEKKREIKEESESVAYILDKRGKRKNK